jgi:membrane protein
MQKIERAFNFAWHVSHERPLGQRFSGYLTVIVVGPVLIFSSLGITATVMSTSAVEGLAAIRPLGTVIEVAGRLVPYVMVIAAFTFIYVFMPNTKVRLRSAFIGAFVAGVLWETTGWAFASFIVTSTKYTAIYSAFATLIMFLIWLYLSWLILLIGASIAFYDQRPEYLTIQRGEPRLSNRMKEKLALLVAYVIGDNYYRGRPAWTAEGLAQRLRVPKGAMESVVQALEQRGLLIRTGGEPPSYLPARPLETTEVKDVLDAIRGADEQAHLNLQRLPAEPAVEQLLDRLDRTTAEVLGGHTLKELALSGTPAAEPGPKMPPG